MPGYRFCLLMWFGLYVLLLHVQGRAANSGRLVYVGADGVPHYRSNNFFIAQMFQCMLKRGWRPYSVQHLPLRLPTTGRPHCPHRLLLTHRRSTRRLRRVWRLLTVLQQHASQPCSRQRTRPSIPPRLRRKTASWVGIASASTSRGSKPTRRNRAFCRSLRRLSATARRVLACPARAKAGASNIGV
jgi:hypothetical protein